MGFPILNLFTIDLGKLQLNSEALIMEVESIMIENLLKSIAKRCTYTRIGHNKINQGILLYIILFAFLLRLFSILILL